MKASKLIDKRSGFRFSLLLFCSSAILCGALLSACSKPAPTASKFPVYKMHGTVVAVHPGDKSASIDAEAIPGFMDAMTMEYSIHDAAALSNLKPKDKITADVVVDPDGAYVENVKIEPQK